MDPCMCMAESLFCPSETITTFLIGYNPTQNKNHTDPYEELLQSAKDGYRVEEDNVNPLNDTFDWLGNSEVPHCRRKDAVVVITYCQVQNNKQFLICR